MSTRLPYFFLLASSSLNNVRIAGSSLLGLDLLHFERDAQAFRKVALSDGEIAGRRRAGVEVLVVPEVRRRHDPGPSANRS